MCLLRHPHDQGTPCSERVGVSFLLGAQGWRDLMRQLVLAPNGCSATTQCSWRVHFTSVLPLDKQLIPDLAQGKMTIN